MSETAVLDNEEEEADLTSRYLTFVLASETYALPIDSVREITRMQVITKVPDVPSYIQGIMNLRGKVIPVMDVRDRFGLEHKPYEARTCIIVIDVHDWLVGLVVDAVSEVVDIPHDQVEPPPHVGGSTAHYLTGIGKVEDDVRLLLDVPQLIGVNA